MATIQFENGTKVKFDGTPTPQDVEEVATSLNISSPPPSKPKPLGQKVLDTGTAVSDFFGGKGVASYLGGRIAKATVPQEQKQFVQTPKLSDPKTVGSALELGSLVLPYGATAKAITSGARAVGLKRGVSALGKVGSGATGGYAIDVGSGLQEGEGAQSFVPGLGTALGAGLGAIGPGLGALQRTAPGLKEASQKGYSEALGATTKKLKEISQKIVPEMAERKIVALSRKGLQEKATGMVEKIGDELDIAYETLPPNAKANIKSTLDTIKKAQEDLRVAGTKFIPESARPEFQALQEIRREIIKLSKKGEVPVKSLRSYRQILDTQIKKSGGGFGMTGAENAKLAAQKTMANSIREEFGKQFPDIAKISKEFTFWKRMQDVVDETVLRKSSQRAPLGEKILTGAGVAGGFSQGGISTALGLATAMKVFSRLVNSTAWKTISSALKAHLADLLSQGKFAEFIRIVNSLESPGDKALKGSKDYFEKNPPSLGLAMKDINRMSKKERDALGLPPLKSRLAAKPEPASFLGFQDLSTKLLEKLKGRTTVSRQFIEDLTNSPDLKQPERDLIRRTLADEADTVSVPDFANRVKSELLPLRVADRELSGGGGTRNIGRYENITLPDELKGDVENYGERIYTSPIRTSAGDVHFSGQQGFNTAEGAGKNRALSNYFAHSRIEDLPEASKTRRVIEIQSDLFQKGRLEGEEGYKAVELGKMLTREDKQTLTKVAQEAKTIREFFDNVPGDTFTGLRKLPQVSDEALFNYAKQGFPETSELSKLEPYRNTWHERVIREEVKQAAKDGKTKLQFPTGETAMKIEGLGDYSQWYTRDQASRANAVSLKPDELKVGQEVFRNGQGAAGMQTADGYWIITDILGDGKFKAVQKRVFDASKAYKVVPDTTPGGRELWLVKNSETGEVLSYPTKKEADSALETFSNLERDAETFDISGKVDTNNPIYKFYEKEVGKYLKNKYGATLITDPQGVKWWEVNIKPEMKRAPVEAFGVGALPVVPQMLGQREN